jgi:hypothetical protein
MQVATKRYYSRGLQLEACNSEKVSQENLIKYGALQQGVSVKTETKTSQGYKSPCVFIEVVLLFVLIFSWNSRFLEYRTLQKSVMIIKEI